MDGQKLCSGGSRRRWIIKNIVLEASRRPGSRKLVFWRSPGGAGSTKIVFWRLPEGCQFGDESEHTAQQPAEESSPNSYFQRFSVIKYSVFSILNVECIVTIYTPRGSRRRWIIKNIVLEGSRRPRSRKLLFWRPPGGVGSSKIVSWRAPEGPGREN